MDYDTDKVNKDGKCTPKCLRDEYTISHFSNAEMGHNYWRVRLFFGKDRFHMRTQYYTYDFSGFLADFGGYLGLLLGSSIMGCYDTLMDLLKKIFGKSKKDGDGCKVKPKRVHRSMKNTFKL